MGNLFAFTGAGFDTTANTMGSTPSRSWLLAIRKWQLWVQEELDYVWAGLKEDDTEAPEYASVFPRLTRVLAVMVSWLTGDILTFIFSIMLL